LIGLGLRGHLSGAIGNLTNLQILTITGNPGLTGNLPSEIGNLTNLTVLDLHDNNFTGVIPNLAGLVNLARLYVYSAQFHLFFQCL
jgi:Leucine-rich repeat (LRR) protein